MANRTARKWRAIAERGRDADKRDLLDRLRWAQEKIERLEDAVRREQSARLLSAGIYRIGPGRVMD